MRRSLFVPSFLLACSALAATPAAGQDGGHIKSTPPLSAAEQLRKFRLPPGFTVQLVAAEPEVRKPINLAFDAAGRLYATQSVEYPYDQPDAERRRDYVSRYVVGPDGRAVSSEVVVRGLSIPIGLAPIAAVDGGEELLVFSIPELLRCRDLDGDGLFETKEPLVTGFGRRDTHGLVNGLTPWIDGWIYACHGFSNESAAQGTDGSTVHMQSGNTFRFRPDGTRLEPFTHGQVNPFGMAFDSWGNVFTADCHTLPAYNLVRGGYYPSFGKPHDGLGFGPAIMRHQHGSTGISGIVHYTADQFPVEYRNTLFIGNPITARINHDRLAEHGGTFEALEQPDFLACDDPWFRPVDLKLGPDGALYVADFYNRVIGHYEVPLDHPQRDRERGRIWRIVYEGPGAKPATMPNVAAADAGELIELLGHPNLAVRTLATNRLAVESSLALAETRLLQVVRSDASVERRVHAVYVLARRRPEALDAALVDGPAADLRPTASALAVHVLRVLGESRSSAHRELLLRHATRALATASDPHVRRAAAEALGRPLGEAALVQTLLDAWAATPADDTHTIYALRVALREQIGDDAVLTTAAAGFDEAEEAKLAEIVVAVPTESAARRLRSWLSERRPARPDWSAIVEYLCRRSAAEELPALETLLAERRSESAEVQATIVRAAFRGLQSRGEKPSSGWSAWGAELIDRLLADADPARLRLGLDLARDLKLPAAFDRAAALVTTSSTPTDLRTAALEVCTACDAAASIGVLEKLLDPRFPDGLRNKALQTLGTLKLEAARRLLADTLRTAPERVQMEAASALVSSAEGAELLLQTVEAGKASARLLNDLNLQRRFERVEVRDRRERIGRLTAGLPPVEEQLATLIDARRRSFTSAKLDLTAGRELFRKHCAACHKFGGEGHKIGPELDGIGRRGLERLLEDTLDPNRNVDQAFRATTFTTTDGRILTGLLLRREGATFVVVDTQGRETRLAANDVEESTTTPLSPMPTIVAAALPEREFANLLGYLLGKP